MHELHTDIEIAAPPEDIWSALVDFSAYSGWNPFIRHVRGGPEEGASLDVRIRPPSARARKIRATVLVVRPMRELRCRMRFLMPEVFEAEHWCLLMPLAEGEVRFEQHLWIDGLASPFLRNRVDRNISRGFREMNAALKGRVERRLARDAPRTEAQLEMPTLEEVLLPDEALPAPAGAAAVEPQVRRRREANAG